MLSDLLVCGESLAPYGERVRLQYRSEFEPQLYYDFHFRTNTIWDGTKSLISQTYHLFFVLFFLFNGISTFIGYLMPKPFS